MQAHVIAVSLALALMPSSALRGGRHPAPHAVMRRAATPLALATAPSANLPSRQLYTKRDTQLPKVLGVLKAGTRKLCVVTGASSGLGLATVKALADEGSTYVICAVRDPEKMRAVAKEAGIKEDAYTAMKLELGSLKSVRDFVGNLKAFKSGRPLERLVCNAAVYLPADPKPSFTDVYRRLSNQRYECSVSSAGATSLLSCTLHLAL